MARYIFKRKMFDMSLGGHQVSIVDLKEQYNQAVQAGSYTGDFRSYRTSQLGATPGTAGSSTNTPGVIDAAYNAAAENRQLTRQNNKAIAAKNPNYFTTRQGKESLKDQANIQKNLDKDAVKTTGGKVSTVSGTVQTQRPKPNPKPGQTTSPNWWNKMGTAGKVGTVAAGGLAAGLIGKSLFGNNDN